jgi:hypothetical protein
MKRGIKTIIGVDNRFNDIKMHFGLSAGNYVSINGGFVWVNAERKGDWGPTNKKCHFDRAAREKRRGEREIFCSIQSRDTMCIRFLLTAPALTPTGSFEMTNRE